MTGTLNIQILEIIFGIITIIAFINMLLESKKNISVIHKLYFGKNYS